MRIPHDRVTVNRFGIWDLGSGIVSQQSEIPNPKSQIAKSGYPLRTFFCPENVSRQNIRGGHGIFKALSFFDERQGFSIWDLGFGIWD